MTGGVYPLWARRDASCIIIMMMNGLLPPRRLSMGKPRRRYIVARGRCACDQSKNVLEGSTMH